MPKAVLVFVDTQSPKPIEIKLDQYGGAAVDWAMAPNPPPVGERVNLKVRIANRTVDNQGFIDETPVYGTTVTLSGSGSWHLYSDNPQYTDVDGSVTFEMSCRQAGSQPMSVVLDNGDTTALDLPACVDTTASSGE